MASVSRKAPRIISRRQARALPYPMSVAKDDPLIMPAELEEELSDTMIVNGMMVSLRGHEPVPDCERNTIHASQYNLLEDTPYKQQYIEQALPGIADEIESFPCKDCERIFLTGHGLIGHTKNEHPENVVEVTYQVEQIEQEWRRREVERGRQRERVQLSKLRQEAIAQAAIRQAALASFSSEFREEGETLTTVGMEDDFENCRICGLLVNQQHPTAMENHMRAHKKNDELREQLVREYGEEFVNHLTCTDCQLVFTNATKLGLHVEAMHVRRRKYVCKWCGHVCQSVTELNGHKSEIHGVAPMNRYVSNMVTRHRIAAQQRQIASGTATALGQKHPSTQPMQGSRMVENHDLHICRTVCEECGLAMVRPSLLIRHMLRVHNRDAFQALIEMRGVPDFRVEVDRGRVNWLCCDQIFTDRQNFHFHRRNVHPPKMIGDELVHEPRSQVIDHQQQIMGVPSRHEPQTIHGELVSGPDGTMHVMVPSTEVMNSGEVYTLVMINDDGEETIVETKQEIRQFAQQVDDDQGEEEQHQIVESSDTEGIAISAEEYEQLRLQYGDDLEGMVVYYSGDEEGELIQQEEMQNEIHQEDLRGDELVDVKRTLQMTSSSHHDDTTTLDEQILEGDGDDGQS